MSSDNGFDLSFLEQEVEAGNDADWAPDAAREKMWDVVHGSGMDVDSGWDVDDGVGEDVTGIYGEWRKAGFKIKSQTEQYLDFINPTDGLINVFCKRGKDTSGRTVDNNADARQPVRLMQDAGADAIWCSVHRLADNVPYEVKKVNKGHVVAYQHLVIDADNIPSVKDTCATDEEHEYVRSKVDKIKSDLLGYDGIPTPLMIDTGNGYGLLVPIELPYNEETYSLMSNLGDALASKYSDDKCDIDTAVVKDPSRIIGVVGTLNRNKTELPEQGRTARLRSIVGECPPYQPMSAEAFTAFAKAFINKYGKPTESGAASTSVDIFEQWDKGSDERQMKRAEAYADATPPPSSGDRNNTAFKLAGHIKAFGIESYDVHRIVEDWNSQLSMPLDADELRQAINSGIYNGTARESKIDDKDFTYKVDPAMILGDGDSLLDVLGAHGLKAVRDNGNKDNDEFVSNLIDLRGLEMERENWLWNERIPTGGATIIYGDMNTGKSHITYDLVRAVTTGGAMPDGTPAPLGNVIFISGEENVKKKILPRMYASGADLSRVRVLRTIAYNKNGKLKRRNFTLQDVDTLKRETKVFPGVKLIIVDPIGSYMSGKDTHKDSEVREVMDPMQQLAEDIDAAVVFVGHENKSRGGKASHKIMGSAAFVNLPRAAFYVAKDPKGEGSVFTHIKAAGEGIQPTLAYQIETRWLDKGGSVVDELKADENIHYKTSRIRWLGESDVSADEAVQASDTPVLKMDEAKELLEEMLADGPRYRGEIMDAAKAQDISERTMWNAKAALGIKAGSFGQFQGKSVWRFQDHEDEKR